MKRLECLDGLRGLLAMYVLVGHLAPFAVLPHWLQAAVSHGGAAVDVFFILSGLVITQSLERVDGQAVPFLLARVARIFPVFLPVFALAVLLQPTSCGFQQMPWIGPADVAHTICSDTWPTTWVAELVAHLTMTNGLFPNGVLPLVWVSFLGPAWSLSTEWQFYVLALLLLGAGAGRMGASMTRLGWQLMLLAAAGVLWHWTAPEDWQFSRAFLANKAHFFALGVASVALVRRRRGGLAVYAATLAGCLTVCALSGSVGKLSPPLVWTLCLAAQTRPAIIGLRSVARILASRMAGYFGAISYCVYVVNEPIHKLLAIGLAGLADGNALLFSALWLPSATLLPILVSDWLHRHVELPALHWGRAAADTWSRGEAGLVGE